jgi:hypothetical protein
MDPMNTTMSSAWLIKFCCSMSTEENEDEE